MEKVAQLLTNVIASHNDYTESQARIIKFGLQCLLGETMKFLVYFTLFSLFSLHGYFVAASVAFCVLRIFAGGYHAKTYSGCLFTSLLLFVIIILPGQYFIFDFYVKITMILLSILLLSIYAPTDHPNKPIISMDRRKRMRILSILVGIGFIASSFFFDNIYSQVILMAVFVEALTLPIGRYFHKQT